MDYIENWKIKSLEIFPAEYETNHIHLTIWHELDTRSSPLLNLLRPPVSSSNGPPSFSHPFIFPSTLSFLPSPSSSLSTTYTVSLSKPSKFPNLRFHSAPSIMLLRAPSAALSVANSLPENLGPLFSSSSSSSSILRLSPARNAGGVVVSASKGANTRPLTGVVFEPFEEVKKELSLIPTAPQVSLARQKYSDACEAAINEQIKWVFLFVFLFRLFLWGILYVGFLWLNFLGFFFSSGKKKNLYVVIYFFNFLMDSFHFLVICLENRNLVWCFHSYYFIMNIILYI